MVKETSERTTETTPRHRFDASKWTKLAGVDDKSPDAAEALSSPIKATAYAWRITHSGKVDAHPARFYGGQDHVMTCDPSFSDAIRAAREVGIVVDKITKIEYLGAIDGFCRAVDVESIKVAVEACSMGETIPISKAIIDGCEPDAICVDESTQPERPSPDLENFLDDGLIAKPCGEQQ